MEEAFFLTKKFNSQELMTIIFISLKTLYEIHHIKE